MLRPPYHIYAECDPLSVPEPDVLLLGAPFESTSSVQGGCRNGPTLIRDASRQIRNYNQRLQEDMCLTISDFGDVTCPPGNMQKACDNIITIIQDLYDELKQPVVGLMGGEHSVTYGGVMAHEVEELTIIHFDAHPDLNDEVYGEKWSHGTYMRRLLSHFPKEIIQVGIRATSLEEDILVSEEESIVQFSAHDIQECWEQFAGVMRTVEGPIYLTVDVDVLDVAYVPNVGNGIPCGLTPFELERLIYSIPGDKIVGFDVTEVGGLTLNSPTAINGAKIIYDILSIIQRGDQSV